MEAIALILGKKGVASVIGIVVFLFVYSHSVKLFDWIEDQTMGTREYLLEKFEQLFIRKFLWWEINTANVTMGLIIMSFGFALTVLVLFTIIGQWKVGFVLSFVAGFIGWKAPRPVVDFFIEKRISLYQTQMVDALNLLGNGLRAGLSLPQSFGMVVDEMDAPVAQEFRLILEQNKVGVPLEECMENLVKRIPIPDNEMFVTSVNILRETGGNLPSVFETITEVIRERVRLQQKIDTFTNQGRVQATIISLMPTGMLLVYLASSPESMSAVFTSLYGISMLAGAYVLNIIGYFAIRKVITIKA